MDTSMNEHDLCQKIEADIDDKKWRTRVGGHQALIGSLLSSKPAFGLYLPLLVKVAQESSTLAQDSSMIALTTFFETVNGDFVSSEPAWDTIVSEVCTALILSTMGTGEKTHERGEAVLLRICETGGCKVVIEALIAEVSNRRLKVPRRASNLCAQSCRSLEAVAYLLH